MLSAEVVDKEMKNKFSKTLNFNKKYIGKIMKSIIFVMALIIALSGNTMFAQKVEVNTKSSSIEWLGKKVVGEHKGGIQVKNGSFELKNDQIISGKFVVDMTTITNSDLEDKGYNKKLVDHLKSDDFFGVKKFPTATFVLTESTKFKNEKATLKGKITIKGKTENSSFIVKRSGNKYMAKIEIDRSKFDVRYGSGSFFDNLGDKAINDIFTLDVKLVLK